MNLTNLGNSLGDSFKTLPLNGLLLIVCICNLTGCAEVSLGQEGETRPTKQAGQERIERREINGIVIYKKKGALEGAGSLGGLDDNENVSEEIVNELRENPVTRHANVHVTMSLSRLTIAGDVRSRNELDKVLELALKEPKVKEVISTVVITDDSEARAVL